GRELRPSAGRRDRRQPARGRARMASRRRARESGAGLPRMLRDCYPRVCPRDRPRLVHQDASQEDMKSAAGEARTKEETAMYRKIMVAFDGSPESRLAVDECSHLMQVSGREIHLVCVLHDPSPYLL